MNLCIHVFDNVILFLYKLVLTHKCVELSLMLPWLFRWVLKGRIEGSLLPSSNNDNNNNKNNNYNNSDNIHKNEISTIPNIIN